MKAPNPASGASGDVKRKPRIAIREPVTEDGLAISQMIARCPPLNRNSVYSTLLLCSHFAGTCALAAGPRGLLGWVSAYIPPTQPDTLFVWQVAVAPEGRGLGLATQLITDILARPKCVDLRRLQTTITIENEASWALFHGLATKFGASLEAAPHFMRRRHFGDEYETEHLLTIAPIVHNAR